MDLADRRTRAVALREMEAGRREYATVERTGAPAHPERPALSSSATLFDDCFGSDSSGDGDYAEHGSGVSWVRPAAALPSWEEVASSEVGGGRGLRATAAIAKDGEIHREPCALRCPNGHAASSVEEALQLHQQCVLSRFTELPAKQQGEIMVLSSWDKYDDGPGNRTVWGIFQTNSVRLSGADEGDGGLFRTMCRMNHSCVPNVVRPSPRLHASLCSTTS